MRLSGTCCMCKTGALSLQMPCCVNPCSRSERKVRCVQDGTPGGMSNLPAAGAKTGGYVPPSLRNRAAGDTGDSMNKRREENSVRVTNLSEDTREDDLRVCTALTCCKLFLVPLGWAVHCLSHATMPLTSSPRSFTEACRCALLALHTAAQIIIVMEHRACAYSSDHTCSCNSSALHGDDVQPPTWPPNAKPD